MRQLILAVCLGVVAISIAGWKGASDYDYFSPAISSTPPSPWDAYCIYNDGTMSPGASVMDAGSFSSGDFTVSLWIKNKGAGDYFAIHYSPDDSYWTFYNDAGRCNNQIPKGIGGSSTTITNEAWMHWVIVSSGQTNGLVYINGVLTTTYVGTATPIGEGGVTCFGGLNYSDTWQQFGNAYLDEIALWSRALSAAEIQSVYTTYGDITKSPWNSGLRAAWHCSEGTGTSCADYSGNGFTLDLGAMTWVEDSPR
jgi:hypothetical protein